MNSNSASHFKNAVIPANAEIHGTVSHAPTPHGFPIGVGNDGVGMGARWRRNIQVRKAVRVQDDS